MAREILAAGIAFVLLGESAQRRRSGGAGCARRP